MAYRMRVLGIIVVLVAAVGSPLAAQDLEMVSKLTSQLGVSQAQAIGGVGAILGTAKGNLSADQFASLLDSAPDLKAISAKMGSEDAAASAGEAAGAATAMAGEASSMAPSGSEEASSAVSGAMASVGEAAGGLDLSSLSQLTGLTKQFEGLGLDAGMVQKFVPVVLEQLGPTSGAAGLLKQGLGLL